MSSLSFSLRPIPGYEGRYSATSDGTIYSHKNSLVLRPWLSGPRRGYQTVGLVRADGTVRKATVHTLVALAFKGARPAGLHVDHIDGDKDNNRPENLEWVTPAENNHRARRLGLNNSRPVTLRGEDKPNCIITDEMLRVARRRRNNGETLAALAAEMGLKKPTLCKAIKHGRAV